jgi:hypothetical protein
MMAISGKKTLHRSRIPASLSMDALHHTVSADGSSLRNSLIRVDDPTGGRHIERMTSHRVFFTAVQSDEAGFMLRNQHDRSRAAALQPPQEAAEA